MRYQPTHAAPRGSVPFMLRGPKSLRTVLNAAVAGAIGLTPAIMLASPAQAVIADYTFEDGTVTVNEGSSMQFTLNRSASTTAETLTWNLVGGLTNAATDEDFTPASGTVTFGANETSKTITVSTTNDSIDENNENVILRVIDAVPNSTPLEATGTINDNDNAPGYKLVFDDASPDEGIGSVTVTAELDGPSGKAVTIPISTRNGTAKFGQDYTALVANSNLTVAPGETTSDSQSITITDDVVFEDKQQDFQVVGGAHASVSGTQSGTVTIVDNEDQPTITIDKDSAAEGSPLGFDVELSGAAEKEVTASYSTVDGTGADLDAADAADDGAATAGVDYTAVTAGTVRFPAGDISQSITVNTRLDLIDEASDENMHVKLSSPTVAKLGDLAVATGSITDDDAAPTVTINPAPSAFNEGNTGRTTKTYTVRLERASGKKVSVDYSTLAGTARDGEDYAAVSGTLTFNPGDTTKTISVDVVGDTMYENNEVFQIDLDSNDATAPVSPYTVTITDDDTRPTLSIAPMSMPEGNAGSVAVFPIKLSNPADEDITIDVSATGGTASVFAANAAPGETDFWAPTSTTIIPAGQTTGYVYFLVNGDDVFEGNEQMTVGVTPAALSVATGGAKTATLTLTNDDAAPVLNVVNAGGSEGDEVQLRGLVTGIAQEDIQLNVNLRGAAANGSPAASAGDFTDPGTIAVTIDGGTYPGSSEDIGLVKLTDDTVAEPAETIQVSGNGFGAGTVNDGWLTIAASDGYTPPTNPGPTNPGPTNPGPTNPGPTNPGPTNPGPTNPGPTNPGPTNPGPTNPVKGTQRPVLTGGSTSAGTATLTVTSNPSTPRAKFIIQRQNANGSWTSVLTSNLMSTGTYKATLRNQPRGTTVNYRAYVYGTDTTTPGYSPIKRVGIRK